MVLVQDDEPINWTWRDNLVSSQLAGDLMISGVETIDLVMASTDSGWDLPAGTWAQRSVAYPFGNIVNTDITGAQRSAQTTPGAIQMPLMDVRYRPLSVNDFAIPPLP